MTRTATDVDGKSSTWLSQDMECLARRVEKQRGDGGRVDFDVVIVGSGYGGAIAAASFAGASVEEGGRQRDITVCVLERGKEYLPGSFPHRVQDLPGHVRFANGTSEQPGGELEGLFDLRLGNDLTTLVANGLGGGSLINAGVMETPRPQVFDCWPTGLQGDGGLLSWYERAREMVGTSTRSTPALDKNAALQALAAGDNSYRPAKITVALDDGANDAGVNLSACILCGDCTTGCNHNAKASLDTNLLFTAWRAGAELYTGATVLRLLPGRGKWLIHLIHTNRQLNLREASPLEISARKVIVAAGTLGSTELLMRSASEALVFSPRLGKKVSGNGDMLAVGVKHACAVNAIADQAESADKRAVGPTITGVIDHRDSGFLIEEMAVPGPLKQVFLEMFHTTYSLAELARSDDTIHIAGSLFEDPWAIDEVQIKNTAIYAVMSHDGADGAIQLPIDHRPDSAVKDQPAQVQGSATIHWPGLSDKPVFSEQIQHLQQLADSSKLGGTILANPAWRPLPAEMDDFIGGKRGPLLSVHPLGGCATANSVTDGVVNHCGQVFKAQAGDDTAVYANLAVLDGAVIPGSLGTNPALTIAAFSLRACEELCSQWGYLPRQQAAPATAVDRPRYAPEADTAAAVQADTEIAVSEKLLGDCRLQTPSGLLSVTVELSLDFASTPVKSLIVARGPRRMILPEESRNRMRIFDQDVWREISRKDLNPAELEHELQRAALFCAPLTGHLDLMQRGPSRPGWRRLRTIYPWAMRRGARDIFAAFMGDRRGFKQGIVNAGPIPGPGFVKRFKSAVALWSRAGEVRTWHYALTIAGAPSGTSPQWFPGLVQGCQLHGDKILTYGRRSNPWQQLCELHLNNAPALAATSCPVLKLDLTHLVRSNVPLLQVTRQADEVSALVDLVSLAAYLARGIISTHIWSFRKPDARLNREPRRLAGELPGLPPPQISEIPVGSAFGGIPILIRLCRYAQPCSSLPPVLLIHGYSASSTTYAHPALKPSLAEALFRQGRDVWLLDLRSSAGLPTAYLPWTFEEIASVDIPVAVDHIYRQCGRQNIDIVAHCMGSAMFSMAVLSADDSFQGVVAPLRGESAKQQSARLPKNIHQMRGDLPGRINRAVLSQVAPVLKLSPANQFRSLLASYLAPLVGGRPFEFRASDNPGMAEQLLDRLLSSLPYPEDEFDVENPPVKFWQARRWTGSRHRMDLLYGRTFNLNNMHGDTLEAIDDFFGPLNLTTVIQVGQFAQFNTLTNVMGRNIFVLKGKLKKHWRFPTLSLHAEDNGLVDISSLNRVTRILTNSGINIKAVPLEKMGHQDSLIGKRCSETQRKISEFLSGPVKNQQTDTLQNLQVDVPWLGPVLAPLDASGKLPISLGSNPTEGEPLSILLLPVSSEARGYSAPDEEIQRALEQSVELADQLATEQYWSKLLAPLDSSTMGWSNGMLALVIKDQVEGLHNPIHGDFAPVILGAPAGGGGIAGALIAKSPGPKGSHLEKNKAALLTVIKDLLEQSQERNGKPLDQAFIPWPRIPQPDKWRLALGSCQYPQGLFYRDLAFTSYRRLWQRNSLPDLLVLTGDQIYADATAGLFDPTMAGDRYIKPYYKLYHQPHVRRVLRQTPVICMLDDHEILDNWQPRPNSKNDDFALRSGVESYLLFQRPAGNTPGWDKHDALPPSLWFTQNFHGLPVFMLDTRVDRQARSLAVTGPPGIISEEQFDELTAWLSNPDDQDKPRLIVSPSALLPRHKDQGLQSDGWDGYPDSLHKLLIYIAQNNIRHVVFLSGDEHLGMVATATIRNDNDPAAGDLATVHSIHTSSLHAPFPFANARKAQFIATDDFELNSIGEPGGYRCEVATQFAPQGDGFTLIDIFKAQGWQLQVEYQREVAGQPITIAL